MKLDQFRKSHGGEGPLDTKHWKMMTAASASYISQQQQACLSFASPKQAIPAINVKSSRSEESKIQKNNHLRVLYRGSYCHLKASMIFSHVHYVASEAKVVNQLQSPAIEMRMNEYGLPMHSIKFRMVPMKNSFLGTIQISERRSVANWKK